MNAPGDSLGWSAGESRLAEASAPDAGLADIVRSSHDAIVGMTLEGVVTTWNPAAEQLYGYRAAEIVGRRAEQLYPPAARAGEAVILRRLARGERLDQYIAERVRRDGNMVTVRLSVSPIAGDAGDIVGVAAAARRVRAAPPTAAGTPNSRRS
nr:hypothetical protein GCM10020092_069050 [Actinoplanes digitatis]